jgi:ribonucleoside-diphosphate reductase alpha chain
MRERLPDRRRCETFDFSVSVGTAVLKYTATVGHYADGRVGELFLNNHKSNSTADTNARDAAIAFSFAVQHGANIEDIRKALCRETDGRASGPLGAALDLLKNNQCCIGNGDRNDSGVRR